MANKTASNSLPPAVKRVAEAFRLTGWISFWAQLVLAIISAIVILFAGANVGGGAAAGQAGAVAANPGTGGGLFFAVLGLIALFAGAYWAFSYTRLARRLKTPDAQVRPKRGDAIKALRIGLLINLSGMLLTILGAQAIVGSLLIKSLAQVGGIFSGNLSRFVTPLDVFVVQANTNTILAHFIAVIATLWLIQVMNRQG
ncbi:MAG: DUF3611 family protein [Oculatellaceae cyanobacterium Prado106]|jgi:amino acid transporter|nr:DUF3611 family protein [Oculatellaceae cyanobacterium Prado106]